MVKASREREIGDVADHHGCAVHCLKSTKGGFFSKKSVTRWMCADV